MMKPCRICKTLVPANEWEAHKRHHHNTTKPRNAKEPEFRRMRLPVLKRDRFTCQKCGRTKRVLDLLGIQLHVHHIDGNHRNNTMGNLTTRCSDCHPRGGSHGR